MIEIDVSFIESKMLRCLFAALNPLQTSSFRCGDSHVN